MAYLNKAQKEALISLGGVTSFCEELAESDFIKSAEDKAKLRLASKVTLEVMETLESGIDIDQFNNVKRFANNCVLMVMPKTSPQCDADLVIVDRAVVQRVVSDSLNECMFCEKKGAQIKNCQRRKDLLNCGCIGMGTDCPFSI